MPNNSGGRKRGPMAPKPFMGGTDKAVAPGPRRPITNSASLSNASGKPMAVTDSSNGYPHDPPAIGSARKTRLVKSLSDYADSVVQQYANQQRKLGAKGYS